MEATNRNPFSYTRPYTCFAPPSPFSRQVKALPGWSGALPSRHYSGYLTVPGAPTLPGDKSRGAHNYHYWFVESEGNPSTDPVGLWLNGGPGSSSLIGFLTENGPFMLNDASLPKGSPPGTVPTLFHRETGWQKAASFIFLERCGGESERKREREKERKREREKERKRERERERERERKRERERERGGERTRP